MKYRKLRIAWSVAWGVVAVLLVAFWVRSYWFYSAASGSIDNCFISIETQSGESMLNVVTAYKAPLQASWRSLPVSVAQFRPQLPKSAKGGFGFWWWPYGKGFGGKVSHLHPIAIAAMLGTLPWLHCVTRFSLRTLLIATTLVAVGLGLIVWAAK
jgi:hypothetical protein